MSVPVANSSRTAAVASIFFNWADSVEIGIDFNVAVFVSIGSFFKAKLVFSA